MRRPARCSFSPSDRALARPPHSDNTAGPVLDFIGQIQAGERLGPYRITRKLAEGGVGVVYEAVHESMGRRAAVKVLTRWLTTDVTRQRFEREVRVCASIQNPHIVDIYDYGETRDGTVYYAMELLDGFDLKRLVELDGPQPAGRVIRTLAQITGALVEAHGLGIVHRDIKPSNIMLSEPGGVPDVAKLVDFGLVMPLQPRSKRITVEGSVIGTPRYLAPEMIRRGAPIGPTTDLYMLGLVAYFLLSGQHAFDGKDRIAILSKQDRSPPPPLGEVIPSAPADLAHLIHRCLQKDPAARPQSARALQDALLDCEDVESWDDDAGRAWWSIWRERVERSDRTTTPDPTSSPPPREPTV